MRECEQKQSSDLFAVRTNNSHEVIDDAVKGRSLEMQRLARLAHALLTRAQRTEVLKTNKQRWWFSDEHGLANKHRAPTCRATTCLGMGLQATQRSRCTSAVLGTTSARSVISIRPAGWPPIVMSKKTTGLLM
eukprot:scaffold54490_cov33-Tisochrysis_lutea.AAC.2